MRKRSYQLAQPKDRGQNLNLKKLGTLGACEKFAVSSNRAEPRSAVFAVSDPKNKAENEVMQLQSEFLRNQYGVATYTGQTIVRPAH
jgi:hypothetical protein